MGEVKTQPDRFEAPYAVGGSPSCMRWLRKIGVDLTDVSRVVIDIRCDKPVAVYVQRFGDADMFEVEPPSDLRDLRATD